MAYDLMAGKQDGNDWSLGSSTSPSPITKTEKPAPAKKFAGGLGWVLALGLGILFTASRKEKW